MEPIARFPAIDMEKRRPFSLGKKWFTKSLRKQQNCTYHSLPTRLPKSQASTLIDGELWIMLPGKRNAKCMDLFSFAYVNQAKSNWKFEVSLHSTINCREVRWGRHEILVCNSRLIALWWRWKTLEFSKKSKKSKIAVHCQYSACHN